MSQQTQESAASDAAAQAKGTGGKAKASQGMAAHARHAVIGFCMGSAEVVPGVSGGTVALVGGVYTRLIDAVRDAVNVGVSVARGKIAEAIDGFKKLDWVFLIPLGLGMVVAILSLARVIEHYLEEEPVTIAGLFLGLVLGSVLVSARLIRKIDATAMLLAIGAGVGLFLLLGLRQDTVGEEAEVANAPLWAYPLAASIAICAWILPGISGSLMLVMMGMYSDVFGALNDRDLLPLVLFAVGAVIGLALFSKLLAWLMDHHHDHMVAAMIGLMLGSTRVLWPWPGGVESTELARPSGDVLLPVLLAVVGFAVILAVGRLGVLADED